MDTDDKLKIFLVDDDPFCRSVCRQHVENTGRFTITEFDNGFDCLSNMDQHPDVIFLDYGMDHLTGLEVLKQIKQINKDIFVVFFSGQSTIATAVKALKLGAIDYLVKGINEPENITKVINKIKELIAVRESKQKLQLKS